METKVCKTASSSSIKLRFGGAWQRMSLALLVALCCHIAASAQETLTVYEGTATSQHIPVFGTYADTQGSASEFVIPSGQLGDMKDGTISALTFYLQQRAAAAWTATIQVYLKEIDATTLTGITGPDASTVVYTGTLDATGTEMTVTFSTPYTYNGGNLLIGTYISVAGNYKSAFFYGVSQNATTAWYRNGSAIAGTGESFIPQTTFTYTPPSSVVPKPNNLAASNITPEQATITWSSDQSAWDISWSTDPDFDPAASVSTRANNVTEKTFTITSLNQLTDYYVAVQNAGSNRWSQKLHFKTTSKPTAVEDGWSDDFEGATCGWELFNGELTNKWTWGTATNNGGTHALYISNDGGTNNTYNTSSSTMVYAAKLLTFTEGTFDFSYDWRADGEGNHDYLRVALIPATVSLTAGTSVPEGLGTTTLPTGWIALDGGSKLNLETDWQSKVATIDVATAGNYYLVFAWCNDGGVGNNPPAAIDNVSISKYPDKVTDLAVSDITTNSATVSWNGNGDSYTVKYTKLFLSEGFEGGMPTGWTSEGDASWSVGTGDYSTSTGSHSGDYNAKITHTTKNNVTYLITPSMDLSGETSVKLSFWFVNKVWVSDIDGFGVYYRVGNNGTWTELWSTTEAHGSWTNQEITLTGLAADYQLGFKMTDGSGFGVGLDDIQILADWQTVNITTKSTTLTGLDANTTYGCQVQSVKGGKTSFWSPIATFTTQLKDIANCIATVPNQTLGRFNPATNSYYKTNKISYLFSDLTAFIGEEVIDGETKLTLGTDYEFGTISYASPDTRYYWDVGNDKVGDVCEVEIVGKGNYAGSTTATFTIVDPSGTWGDDNELSWSLDEGALSITLTTPANGNKAMKAAETYGKYPWNYYCSDVTSISIGDGITSIANYAFGGLGGINTYSSVATVTLPSTLTSIGAEAFLGCSGATITIPTSVTTLGNNPFSNVAKVICTLNDNNSDFYSKLTTATSAEITYKRTFTEKVASTVCLPFAHTPGTGEGTYYTFTSINKETSPWTVTMTSTAASLTANTPYMFMPAATRELSFNGTASNFTNDLTGADVDDPDVTGGKWNLIGTYATKQWDGTHNTSEIGSVYGFAATSYNPGSYTVNPGDFVKAAAGASIAPFRAYLKYTAPGSSAPNRRAADEEVLPSRLSVRLVNAEGIVTAIGTIDTNTGEVRFDSDAWYSIDGSRLNGKPAQKGVYINNGKKIIIK